MENEIIDPIVTSNIFSGNALLEFTVRYLINFIFCVSIVRFIYYRRSKNKDFLLTFILFNSVNFFICFLLSSAKLKTGFAFGLFAIFSILRYRTVMVPIREMGFFFVSVTLGLINSLSLLENTDGFMILMLANIVISILVFILDTGLSLDHEHTKEIIYEKIELVKPELRQQLIDDLKARTGLPIHRVDITKIDFLKDVAYIQVFYYSKKVPIFASKLEQHEE